MKKKLAFLLACGTVIASGAAQATTLTMTSPTSAGLVPTGVSEIGGIVVDLIGTNGNRVVSQLAASSLFIGFYDNGTPTSYRGNPGTIGVQSGFNSTVMNALGGGIVEAAFRFTLYDGDTGYNNFDYDDDNFLLVNGINFGDWSDVATENTTNIGTAGGAGQSNGFRDETLDTGWFYSTNSASLSSLYDSLVSAGTLTFMVQDIDPYDNYYDFTRGIDSSLINVGTGPVVQPPVGAVPEPTTVLLFSVGLAGLAAASRRRA